MKVPFVDLRKLHEPVMNEINAAVKEVADSGAFILGDAVKNFETEFARLHDVKHCVGLSSGTDANHAILWALGTGQSDEVIIPANTFIATAWGATLCGAVPVFVDCDKESYNMDPGKVQEKISPKTKAIVAVHLYGQPSGLDELRKIADDNGIPLIEDAAQAHLSEYKGKKAGGIGMAASFSFYPAKNLGAFGESGAVTTNDDQLAESIRKLRDHGSSKKYYHETHGHNYRMEGIQGAVLGVKLKYLKKWNDNRRIAAEKYSEHLKSVGEITLPVELPGSNHVYHLYVIQTKKRNELQTFLNDNGISTGLHYPVPLHLQECFKNLNYKKGDFPVTEKLADECLSLPMFPDITEDQIYYVSEKIKHFFKR